MAGKPRNKPSIQEQIENVKEGETIHIEPQTVDVEKKPKLNYQNLYTAVAALNRISVIHDHPGSCSKNCPALIAQEALRKIRG